MRLLDLDGLDPDEIGRLMMLLAATDVEECEIQQGEYGISLKRSTLPVPTPGTSNSKAERSATEESPFVPSPAVGVFYRSEGKADAPSVEAGTRVKAGEVLGVIEVMGVPHPVVSTRDGVIGDFVVEDGEPVEYGQPIVAIGH